VCDAADDPPGIAALGEEEEEADMSVVGLLLLGLLLGLLLLLLLLLALSHAFSVLGEDFLSVAADSQLALAKPSQRTRYSTSPRGVVLSSNMASPFSRIRRCRTMGGVDKTAGDLLRRRRRASSLLTRQTRLRSSASCSGHNFSFH
jgi:hypothetical protein